MQTVDLHTHSNQSDGTLTPEALVQLAADLGLSAIALTDHDTADGLFEAEKTAAALQQSGGQIEFIPGIELSVSCMEKELHIVGLYLDTKGQAFNEALEKLQKNREQRNNKMIARMQEAGIDITTDKIKADQGDGILTRANFASYLMHIGYITTIQEAFDKYLGDEKCFYIPRQYMDPKDAIDLIHNVHGIAILAHPLLYHFTQKQLDTAVRHLSDLGLDGLETWYSMNSGNDLQRMKKLADRYDLLYSGGSDFHGNNKPHIQLGRGRGNLFIPSDILKRQKDRKKLY